MVFHNRKFRALSPFGILWVLCCLFVGAAGLDNVHGSAPGLVATPRSQPAPIVVRLPTSPPANSTVNGEVTGVPAPVGGAPAPFKLVVEINEWEFGTATATYNWDKGRWDFSIQLPPGSTGSTLRVTLISEDPDTAPVTKLVTIS